MFLQEIFEHGGSRNPSAVRWLNNRYYKASLNSPSMSFVLFIGELNDTAVYDKATIDTSAQGPYPYLAGSDEEAIAAYELNKW